MPSSGPSSGAGSAATIVFVEGSTSLSKPAADEVKAFAGKRGKGAIVVTGFGDGTSSDPTAQSAALVLALARAQVVADALKQAGVPDNAVRVNAEASGRGASLRLIQ
jgi:outer membrane protein OmpA-like peptidoglycan-associated protein